MHMMHKTGRLQAVLQLIAALTIVGWSALASGDSSQDQNNSSQQRDPTLPVVVEAFEPTVVSYNDYYDPFENLNRKIFNFNDFIYRKLLIPVSNGYVSLTPGPVRTGVNGVLHNLQEPLFALNHLLQADLNSAGNNVARFLVNSTVGLLGLFDPAENWLEIPRDDTTMSDTFTQFGFAQGPYMVLPVIGVSDLRNTVSRITGSALNPIRVVTDNPDTTGWILFDNFQLFAPSASAYIDLYSESTDPYIYFRNQYLQGVSRDQESQDAAQ